MKIGARTKILLVAILALLFIPLLANDASGGSSVKVSKLTAGPDAGPFKKFGHSIAVSGDTMVFGAPYENAAYVFEQDKGEWKKVARLTPNGSTSFTYFGWSVAISGDTIVVGAPYDQSFKGSVYVFKRVGDSWNEDAATLLTTSDLLPFFALFGWSLAFEGSTLLVGAPTVDATYVYSPEGAEWPQEEATLTDGDAELGDRFGWAVAISGAKLVVGAPRDEFTAGSAYVFELDKAEWLKTAKLTASDKAEHDEFGFAVAIHNDTVVVGARKDSLYVSNPGAAYVFEFDGESWLQKPKLTASDSVDYDEFGYSVAIKDSILLVGAPFDPFYGPEAIPGAAYVFEADGNIWSEKLKLSASDAGDPPEQDQFGFSTAINGTTMVVGAILADVAVADETDSKLQDAGAAYAFVTNEPPVAVANWDPEEGIIEGDEIKLDGSESYDPDGDQLTYHWEQTGGPDVGSDLLLAKAKYDPKNPVRIFNAPELTAGCSTLTFQLTVTDDQGLASEPATVEITVSPNNKIYAKLGGKRRHWFYWHKYSFYGHKNEQVTIKLEADPNGWHRGRRATLILKDKIKRYRLFRTNRGSLPNTINATLRADGKYTVYVVKQPWFWFWWRHKRHKRFEGDYILSLEGTCGKLVKGFRCNKR